jgi:oxalate decarboxylase/phosphoglucose isomerase-like protein (cupin superfamily)
MSPAPHETSGPFEHPAVAFRDSRGEITDLVENEVFDAATVISSTSGAVRGNHYHLETYQVTYVVSGRLEVVTQVPGEEVVTRVAEAGDLVRSPPAEHHALRALEPTVMFVLTRGPRGGQAYESDTIRLDVPLIAS